MGNEPPIDSGKDSSLESERNSLGNFWSELRRRKVVRVAITYAIVAWFIMQVAGLTFEGFGVPIWAFRFVVLMLWLFFPVALIITWAFELTPDGIALTKAPDKSPHPPETSAAQNKRRNWAAYGVGALMPTLIFGSLALFFFLRAPGPDSPDTVVVPDDIQKLEKSIAVLPFDNRSDLKSDEYFTDGIHDDLLTQISRIKEIKTISRTSVMVYKNSPKNLKTIGDELGVSTILEGGVQRSGNMIRINAQLIDAATDAHIWAKTYDREMSAENVFRIQSEIAIAIADALKAVLSPEVKQDIDRLPTKNLDALEAFFQSEALTKVSEHEKKIQLLEKAIALDPNFADAYAALGEVIVREHRIFHRPIEDLVPRAEPLLRKALDLDPRNSQAYIGIGRIKLHLEQLEEAEAAYQRAIELSPSNARAYEFYSYLLAWPMRNPEAALDIIFKGIQVDPQNRQLKLIYIRYLAICGRIEEALQQLEQFQALYPEDSMTSEFAEVYRMTSQYDEAARIYRKLHYADPLDTAFPRELSRVYGSLGDYDEAAFWENRNYQLTTGGEITLSRKIWQLAVNEKWEEAESLIANSLIDARSIEDIIWWRLMINDLHSGNPRRPMERLKSVFPEVFENDYQIDGKMSKWKLFNIAFAIYSAGELEKANALFEKFVGHYGEDEIMLACVYAVTERIEDAISIMKKDPQGYVGYYYFPIFTALRGHPEFEALMKEPLQELERQRQQLAEWEANGELAPIPPLPEKNVRH